MGDGRLFVVATPIGNLEDITLRALRVLREADLVCAEDTRHSRILLDKHGIDRPLTSVHEHNEDAKIPVVLAALRDGKKVALITDAGTPVMNDPGYRVIRAAREAGLAVEVIPGPSAIVAAVSGAGIPAEMFSFVGFPPRKTGERARWAKKVLTFPTAVVFFESPFRVVATLAALAELAPEREAAVARELTKKHEEFVRGPLAELAKKLSDREEIRGEITVVLATPGGARPAIVESTEEDEEEESTARVAHVSGPDEDDEDGTELSGGLSAMPDITEERTIDIEAEIARLQATGMRDKDVAKEIGRLTGRSARDIYADLIARKT